MALKGETARGLNRGGRGDARSREVYLNITNVDTGNGIIRE